MSDTINYTITPSAHVVTQQIGDEIVLLDLQKEQYFGLNPVAARAWQLMGEKVTMQAISTRLLAEFDVSEAELLRDLGELVQQLEASGLIRCDAVPDVA